MLKFTEEHEAFRTAFKKFVENEMASHLEEWDKNHEFPREMWNKLGEQGYLCPWVPEEYGGAGADFLYSYIINYELAKAGAAIGIGLHSDIIAPYIASFGTEEQKQKYLPGCASGDIVLAVAMTEPGAGSDLQAIKTTAVKDNGQWVLNGQKTFISNGISCDLAVVAAKTNLQVKPSEGMSLFLVEANTPGFIKSRKLDKMGLNSQDTAELFFEDCRVPAGSLLGEEGNGFKYLMQKLQQERLVSSMFSQGLAERMLEDAVEYAKTRQAFGKPIGKFQHNAFKIAEMATEVQMGHTFLDDLVERHIEGEEIVTRVSMAKYWIGEMANRVAYNALQLYGGYGYMDEYPISRHYRDVRCHTIYAGSSEIMKLIISRNMGF